MTTHLLIDANNLAARCFHQPGLAKLTADDGTKTGAIYGFLKGLSWVMHKANVSPDNVVLLWDGGHSIDRILLLPTYKKGRKLNEPKTPEDVELSESYRYQLTSIRDLLAHREFRQVCVDGVEADDLIGIFAQLLKHKDRVVIYSGDQDLWQLYSTNVIVWDPKRETFIAAADFTTKFGIEPADFLFFKTLVGDNSDNIPGVKTVGPKRATVVCRYLEHRFIKGEPKVLVKPQFKGGTIWKDREGANAKYVDKVLEATSRKIVRRNLRLMRIPKTFEQSFLSWEQAEDSLTQFLNPGVRRTGPFFRGLRKYNIDANTVVTW